jgi:GNAT superfamily N-acetyltransferase
MAFSSSTTQFAVGWYGGGNRRRFERMAAAQAAPMGVVAVVDDQPIAWCSCGPRLRYIAAIADRSRLLAHRPRFEDQDVWLAACIFVRPDYRGRGVPRPLLQGAVSIAQENGASAIEAWPLARGVQRPEDAHVGREELFADLGFRSIQKLGSDRTFMRLDLVPADTQQDAETST